MSEPFDAYYKWLAIPPEEQPPDHYRLLGVKQFESDADVIESAADQRMVHLRNFQSGKNAAHSQRLLNEVSAAKGVLLTPEKRSEYDKKLRRKIEECSLPKALPIGTPMPPITAGGSPPPPPVGTPAPLPMASPAPLPVAAVQATPAYEPVAPVGVPVSPPVEPKPGEVYTTTPGMLHRSHGARKKAPWLLPVMIAGAMAGVLGLLLCAGGLYFLFSSPADTDIAYGDDGRVVPAPLDPRTTDGDDDAADGSDVNGDTDGDTDAAPTPVDPMPVDPAPVDPAPVDPMPVDPAPVDPMPVDPMPVDPMPPPVEPMPVDPMPVDPMPVEPPKAVKAEFPPKAELDAAEAKVSEVMKLATITENSARVAKADEMLQLAKDPASPLSERFALLRKASQLAEDAGDSAVVLRAVGEMEKVFEFDADRSRAVLLAGTAKNVTPETLEPLMIDSGRFLDDLVHNERLDVALMLMEELHRTIPTKGVAGRNLRKPLNDRLKEIKDLHKVWQVAENARLALETNPDDPLKNLVYGRYLSLTKGEFDAGVKHLSKTEDEALKSAADIDLAASQSQVTADMLAAADAWYSVAEKDEADAAFYARAHHWYELVKDDVGSLDKIRVTERLGAIAKVDAAQQLLAGIAERTDVEDDAPTRVVAKKVASLPGAASGDVAIAFLPDSKSLAAGYSDGSLRLWNLENRQATWTKPGHSGRINDVTVSKDGEIVTVGSDKLAVLWDDQGTKYPLAPGGRYDFQLARFAPNGVLLLARYGDVSFMDAGKRKGLGAFQTNSQRFEDVSFSADGKTMALRTFNKVVLSSLSGQVLPPVDLAQDSAQDVVFSPDGQLLAIAPSNGKIVLYDSTDRKSRSLESYTSVRHLEFSPDGKTLAAGWSNSVQLIDVKTGQPWNTLDATHYLHTMRFSPDGKLLATGSSDGSINLWEVSRERILSPPPTKADLAGSDEEGAQWQLRGTLDFGHDVDDVKFSPDGGRLAVTDGNQVRIYDADHGAPLGSLSGHQSNVQHIAWAPDGKRLATASSDRSVRIWDAASWSELSQIHGSRSVKAIGFSADGKQILIARDDGAQLHAVPGGDSSIPIDLGTISSIYDSVAAADGAGYVLVVRKVTSPSRPMIFAFDSTTPKTTLTSESYALAMSNGGTHVLAYSSSTSLDIYTGEFKTPQATIRTSGSQRGAAFHPGKKMLALGGYDRNVTLWSAETGKLILALTGHTDAVNAVDFSSDGKSLATGSRDNTVKIWSPAKSASSE
ncbi:MAG: hypothetical protein RIC55_17220 [Pirellulaceae bacterium]